MSRGLQRGAFILGLCLLSATAGAQTNYRFLEHRVLNTSQDPFRFYVDARDTKPAGIDLNLVETAVKGAFQTWQDVDCAWPAFEYAGRATSGATGNVPDLSDRNDRFNVTAIWVQSKADPLYQQTVNRDDHLAVPLTYGGVVYQCDVFLNAVDFRWSTLSPVPEGYLDLQSRMTQAVGTCLGLDRVSDIDLNSVMFTVPEPGVNRRQLSDYDRGAICQRYPQTGAVGSPCNTGTCSGSTATLCATTQSPASGGTLSMCTKSCTGTTGGECPDPYVCRAYGAGKACQPPAADSVTKIGQACDGGTDCGSARSRCIDGDDFLPSGFPAWQDGYCVESCSVTTDCPTGSVCTEAGALGRICLKRCEPGAGDCREGYACSGSTEGFICVPACYSNADCGGGTDFACQVCDRTCVAKQSSGKQVGEPCAADTECGQGQSCLRLNDNPQGVCTQACSLAACSCSPGTTCRQAGPSGERYCLKECATGTCTSPLLCTSLAQGSACLSTCRTEADCPPGLQCGTGGRCVDPKAKPDGGSGTCTLCSDGGTQPPPPPPDGGTGGSSGPDGCGCHSAPTSAAFLTGLGVLLLAMRRRNWPRR